MIRSRMINKKTGEETILIDKKEVDGLKARVSTLHSQLNGANAFIKAQEVEIANLQEQVNEYDSNIVCKAILQFTRLCKRCIAYVISVIKKERREYRFLQ